MKPAVTAPLSSITTSNVSTTLASVRRAPDSIMSELWSVKARMNAEAGYDVDRLLSNVKQLAQNTRTLIKPQSSAV